MNDCCELSISSLLCIRHFIQHVVSSYVIYVFALSLNTNYNDGLRNKVIDTTKGIAISHDLKNACDRLC